MKCLLKSTIVKQKQIEHVINEKRIISSVNFPFFVNLALSGKDNDYLYIGMPFVNGGELFIHFRR